MHAQVTYVYHKTGTMGADDWYKNAFKPFLDGGLHSGEVGNNACSSGCLTGVSESDHALPWLY